MPALPTWRQLHADSSPAIEAVQFARLREAPAWVKLEMLAGLNRMAFEAAYLSLRRRYPEMTEPDLIDQLNRVLERDPPLPSAYPLHRDAATPV